jgi:hypothetical protein
LVACFVSLEKTVGRPVFDGDSVNVIAIVVVHDEDVVVATAGLDWEATSLVGVGLAGG